MSSNAAKLLGISESEYILLYGTPIDQALESFKSTFRQAIFMKIAENPNIVKAEILEQIGLLANPDNSKKEQE